MGESSNGTESQVFERIERICCRPGCENVAALNHKWCRECKRNMQTKYGEAREEGIEQRGFVRGANAMKRKLLQDIQKFNPGGMLRAVEVAGWIGKAEIPAFTEEVKLTEPDPKDPPEAPEGDEIKLKEPADPKTAAPASGKSNRSAAR